MQTILWDWNGTLLDDVALCSRLVNEMLKRHGYAPVGDLDAYRRVFCFPIETYYQNAGFDFARHPFAQLAVEYTDLYEPQSRDCCLQPGAVQVLNTLRQRGATQVILSASPLPMLKWQVEHLGVASYFDTLLGLTDVYAKSKIALGKDWLESSQICPQNAVMIGDSVHDFEVACALGVGCVLVSRGHQSREVLSATGAVVVDNLMDLLQIV